MIRSIRLALLSFLLLYAVSLSAQDSINRSNYQLLWEITGPDLSGPSYLFGSMHVRDEAVFEFPDSLLVYLKSVDAFANEVQFDSAMYTMLQYQFRGYHDDFLVEQALFDPLEPVDSIWAKAKKKEVQDSKAKRKERVNAFIDMLSADNITNNSFPTMLDSYLMDIARSEGKLIFGLENLKEQMGSVFVEEEGSGLGNDKLSSKLAEAADFSVLKRAYRSGDLHSIWDIMQSMDSVDIWDLERRNYHMVRSMRKIMPEHSLFTVVGAAHLPGPHGILRQLERRGYRVRPVTSSFNGKERPMAKPRVQSYQAYYGPQNMFKVDFPNYVVSFQNEYGGRGLVHVDIGKGLFFQIGMYDFLQIDDGELESTFFGDEEAEIASRDTIATSPWLIIDYLSEEFDADEALGNYRARVYFQHGRAYLVYVATYLHEQLFHPEADYFIDSFEPAEMKSGFETIIDSTAAFSVRMPANTAQYTLVENDYDIRDAAYQYKIRIYQGANLETGTRYFVRWTGLSPGEGVKNTNDFLWDRLNFIERFFETEIDTTQLQMGTDSLSYTGQVRLNDSLALHYKLLVRANRAYIIACESTENEQEAKTFIDSFTKLPQGNQVYGLEALLDGVLPTYMPQPVVHTTEDYSDYAASSTLKDHYYYTTDTLNSMTYFVTISEYSPLYRAEGEEAFLDQMVEGFMEDIDTTIYRKTISLMDGTQARDLWVTSEGTHMQHRAVLYPLGLYTIQRYAYGTKEQLRSERLDSFLYRVPKIPDSILQRSLFSSKLDTILAYINQGDSIARTKVKRVVSTYNTGPEESKLLQNLIQSNASKDILLFRLLGQRPTAELYEFYQNLYPSVANQKELREAILSDLGGDRKKPSLDLFFKLLLKTPPNTVEYTSIFSTFFDSTALVKTYYPELSEAFRQRIYPQFIYYLLEQALMEETLLFKDFDAEPFIQMGEEVLHSWEPLAEKVDDPKIEQRNPVYVIDLYREADLADPRMGAQLLAFAKKWPQEDYGFKALEVLISNDYKIPRKLIVEVAKSENYLSLLAALSRYSALDRLPNRWYQEDRIARLMLARDFREYGISAENIREDGRFIAEFNGEEGAYYRFRFNDEESKNRVAVVAIFPSNKKKKKASIDLTLVNYSYGSVKASAYRRTALELLEEMEEW